MLVIAEKFLKFIQGANHPLLILSNMKKPVSLEDYKAYAFGIAMIAFFFLAPFATIKILTYVF